MNKTEETEMNSRRLGLACRWSLYSWAAIILGVLVTKPLIPSAGMLGMVFFMAGIVYAFIAFGLALFGLVASRHRRWLFLSPLALSAPPIVFQIWTMM